MMLYFGKNINIYASDYFCNSTTKQEFNNGTSNLSLESFLCCWYSSLLRKR